MFRVLAIAACGIALAACSSSGDAMKTATPTIPLQFESEPPGAEVKTSSGQTCKTPCALAVPATDFMATYAMNGFTPQTVPVKLVAPDDPRGDSEFTNVGNPPRFVPNPVYAELERAKPKKGAPAKKPRVAGSPPPQPRAMAPDDAPPQRAPAQRQPAPAQSSSSPWPPAANPVR